MTEDPHNDSSFKASEHYYRMLAEASRDFVFVINRDLKYEYLNAIAAEVIGMKVEEVVGRRWVEFFPEDKFPGQLADLKKVLATGEAISIENETYIPKLEKSIWLDTSLTPIRDDDGNVQAVMGVSRDITLQKEADIALRASEQRYRMLAEAAQDSIFIIDLDGVITYLNQHGARMYGETQDAIIGRKMTDLFPKDIAEVQSQSIKSVIGADMPLYSEQYAVMPMGDIWLGTSLSPVKDDHGKITGVLGIARNITAKKKAETELITERDFSDRAINSMPGIFYLLNEDGRFIRWNQKFTKVSGYSSEEITELNPLDLFAGNDRELISSQIKDVFKNGEADAEADLIDKNGKSTRFYFTCYRMVVGEEPYLVGVGTDISELRKTEENLTERESKLKIERDRAQKYLDITPALVVSLDTDGIVRLMNQKGCEILEGEVEEIVGKDWFDNFVPEDIRSEVKRVFARLMAGEAEAVEYYENTVLTLRGTQKIVAWHNTVLYDDEGETIGILSSGEDITERRAAQNMLRESEHRFKTMFDTAISGIILADFETKRFVLCNDTICNMLGYSHEEFLAMGVADIHPEDSLPFVFEQFDKQVRGETKIARDLPVKRKDGSVFYADVSSAPVTLSGIKYLMSYFSDSTERMLAESALMESEERYRSIFEESNEVIFISTPEGRLEDINPTGVALFGYPSREAMMEIDIGKELFVDAEARIQYQERIERSGAVQHYEMKLRKKDGEEVIVSVSARAVEDDSGNVINYRGVMRDITEQRRLENQLIQSQKMESIGNLAGGVAHDFNNYLTAIQGYADLALLELPEDSVLQDYLSEIRSSSVRAADLTRQLLLFGRREDIVLKPVELAETISSIQKMLGRLIGERYTIVTRIPGNLALIMADKGLVEQVIVNLVVNSRDAMPEGGEVTIDAANVELEKEPLIRASGLPGGDYIHIKVSDNGHGIDSEPLKRIFEPFYTTKDVGKGTGLGLSVVYGIITQHNGMIDVESEVGRGTTFNIYIPAAQDAHEAGEITPTGRGGVMGSGMRLLLVEDDEAVRNLASRMLVENGFIVSTAASAGEAEKIFNENQGEYDIVFSDVILPDDNGVFLVERLREKKPDMSIVLASGYTGEELDRGQIEEKGFTFLQKPYTLTELLGIIGELAKK